jgi:hypothetical protein
MHALKIHPNFQKKKSTRHDHNGYFLRKNQIEFGVDQRGGAKFVILRRFKPFWACPHLWSHNQFLSHGGWLNAWKFTGSYPTFNQKTNNEHLIISSFKDVSCEGTKGDKNRQSSNNHLENLKNLYLVLPISLLSNCEIVKCHKLQKTQSLTWFKHTLLTLPIYEIHRIWSIHNIKKIDALSYNLMQPVFWIYSVWDNAYYL